MALSATVDEGGGIVAWPLTWDSDMAQALRAYAANPLFRSASVDELVINDNPYRRPVRPDDLEWLKFDRPIGRGDSSRLSSLLGHRMLLNIYDARLPLVPAAMSEQRRQDFELFYDSHSRTRGERVRPFLEHHLFDYVHDTQPQPQPSLEEALRGLAEERSAAAAGLLGQVDGASDRMLAGTMATLQIVGEVLAPAGEGAAAEPAPEPGSGSRYPSWPGPSALPRNATATISSTCRRRSR